MYYARIFNHPSIKYPEKLSTNYMVKKKKKGQGIKIDKILHEIGISKVSHNDKKLGKAPR